MDKRILVLLTLLAGVTTTLQAADSRTVNFPASQVSLTVTDDGNKLLTWPRLPALETNELASGSDIHGLTPVNRFFIGGDSASYSFSTSNALSHEFFSLRQAQLSSNALLAANVMNRVAYGPTPDLQKRLLTGPNPVGPQYYLDEQLNFHNLPDDPLDTFEVTTTNAIPPEARLRTDWVKVTVEGEFSTGRLYMYLSQPGEAYIDNIQIYSGIGEEIDYSTNFVQNGDFETPLTGPWTVSPNMAGSSISSAFAQSGSSSLRLAATVGGTTRTSSIWQDLSPAVPLEGDATLCFYYLPRTNSSIITLRLSGSGISGSPVNESGTEPEWIYVTQTGNASSTKLYIYLDAAGTAYVDDMKLVAGTQAGVGPNLLANGDFESPLQPTWVVAPVASNSFITPYVAFEGAGSLQLQFSARGTTEESAVVQYDLPLTIGQPYTLSYWYAPSDPDLTVRLSGGGILSNPDSGIQSVYRRLATTTEGSELSDLRAWFIQHAVNSDRQLLEILTQFWENHFVTQHSKSADYFDRFYDGGIMGRLATNLEFREISKWRQAMLNPNVRFYDLLRIHAESPAQIIYLDTVDSRGDLIGGGPNRYIANENYSREILELFCNGVDNGYDQDDIVRMSGAWTGWTVDIKAEEDIDDPFAPRATQFKVPGSNSRSNLLGVWTFHYNPALHDTRQKVLFPGKTVAARFGAPWAGRNYELVLPARSGNAGIQDGYDIVTHLASLPYTMEHISVKLCRLFIHDGFVHGVYDYSDPSTLSEEGKLVHQCMMAWESGLGRLRPVLDAIFDSHLFRGHAASNQKVKTPLEFCVSTIRALRSELPDGSFTGSTDGYSIAGTGSGSRSHISRMGLMRLFDRGDPDGYPEDGPAWISAGTLAERIRFVQTALMAAGDPDKDDDIDGDNNNRTDPVALLKNNLPAAAWRDSLRVSDYFTTLFFPGEGRANLEDYRNSANTFLNRDESGVFFSSFNALGHTSAEYDTRVRGMVALLLSFQRFQEQ